MPRLGTCKACGARFKVPDSVTAARAKCAKCGGVVEIAAAEGAPVAAGSTPAAPRTTAPLRSVTAAPTAQAPVAPKAGGPSAAPAPRMSGARSGRAAGKATARSERGTAGARQGKEKSLPPSAIVGAIVVFGALIGLGVWFLTGDDPAPVQPSGAGATETPATEGIGPPPAPATGADAGPATAPAAGLDSSPSAIKTAEPAAATANLAASAAPAASAADGPALEPAPAPVEAGAPLDQQAAPAASAVDPNVPLPTVLAYAPIPPLPHVTQAQQDEWMALIRSAFVDYGGATGRKRRDLLAQLDAIDAVDSYPAYVNALIGVDMAEDTSIIATFNLVKYWQGRVAGIPRFNFSGDATDKTIRQQNLRVQAIIDWPGWMASNATKDAETLATYRQRVADALRLKASSPGEGG